MNDDNRYRSYHEGELAVQQRAGVGSDGLKASDMYKAGMPSGVQRFLAAQQLAVLSTMDADGHLWASMRSGPPGFLRALDTQHVEIGGDAVAGDPLLVNVATRSPAGMIVINLAARQRVRLNGTAEASSDGRIVLMTEQVYGNCPQYIQSRGVTGEREPKSLAPRPITRLDDRLRAWIAEVDTLFIATAHPQAGNDASHRGGKPGFLRVDGGDRLSFPDYRGNNMFNTLGNIAVYPQAGLLIPDFRTGAALLASGAARILWDDPRIAAFAGAQRLIEVDVERLIELPQATRLQFQFGSYSPSLP